MISLKNAVVLAGGQSKRFGSNKAMYRLGGEPQSMSMLDIATTQLKSANFNVFLNLNRNGYEVETSLPIIYDSGKQKGPLFAVRDVLSFFMGMTGRLLITTCDMPFVGAASYRKLWDASENQPDKIIHYENNPFPAVYPIKCLQDIKNLIQSGSRSMKALLAAVEAHRLRPVDPDTLRNINIVDDTFEIFDAPNLKPF